MKIKGHSIIELTNVKTGEVERYEDDNMVTNALSLYFEDLGMLNVSSLFTNGVRNDFINTLLGGLLLFDDTITEDVNNVTCPGGIKMVGNGCYDVVADGEDGVTELGSWNYTESGWKSDGSYHMVWDFADTQANGEIACACLTSANHGYIGEGNSTSKVGRSTPRSDYAYTGTSQSYYLDSNEQELTRLVKTSRTDSTVTYVDEHNIYYNATYASEHMSQTGKLKLITQKVPLKKLDLRMTYPARNTAGETYIPVTTTELTLPTAFLTQLGSATPWFSLRCGDYYYMLAKSPGGLASGATVQGVKINCSTLAVTGFTITNTTSDTIGISNTFRIAFGSNTIAMLCTYKEGGENKTGIIFQDLSNNADTDIVEINTGENARFIREETCMMGSCKIDFIDRTVYPTNIGDGDKAFGTSTLDGNPLIEHYTYYIVNRGYIGQEYNLYRSTNYLATINNLSAPVTKTAEKSMKVTYILRFDDGE